MILAKTPSERSNVTVLLQLQLDDHMKRGHVVGWLRLAYDWSKID